MPLDPLSYQCRWKDDPVQIKDLSKIRKRKIILIMWSRLEILNKFYEIVNTNMYIAQQRLIEGF